MLTENTIFGVRLLVLVLGKAGKSSHSPVSAHQIDSRMNVFPRLLSPVMMLSLYAGS